MQVERLTICFICEFTSFIYNSLAKKHDIIIIIEFRGFVKPPASISVRCYLIEISSAEMKSAPSITHMFGKGCTAVSYRFEYKIQTMPAKSLGTLAMIYAIDEL